MLAHSVVAHGGRIARLARSTRRGGKTREEYGVGTCHTAPRAFALGVVWSAGDLYVRMIGPEGGLRSRRTCGRNEAWSPYRSVGYGEDHEGGRRRGGSSQTVASAEISRSRRLISRRANRFNGQNSTQNISQKPRDNGTPPRPRQMDRPVRADLERQPAVGSKYSRGACPPIDDTMRGM